MVDSPNTQPQTLGLEDFLDAATLQQIQGAFVAATGTQICFHDRDGRPVTEPVNPAMFCPHAGKGDGALSAGVADACRQGSDAPVIVSCDGCHQHTAIPIRFDQHVLGMLVMGQAQGTAAPRTTTPESAPQTASAPSPVADLAQLLGSILSRLCYQDQQLRLRIEELGALYGISGLLAGSFDLQQVLNEVVRRVGEVMRVKSCSLRLFNEDTGELLIKAVYNLSPEYLNKGAVRVAENPVDAQALSGQTVYVEDVPNDPRVRYPEEARREGFRSGLITGMFYRGRPIGVLRVYTSEKHHFSAFEAGLLRAMAAQAASAIETARLYQEELQAERVRKQIAMAGDVQRRMIPARAPAHPRLTFGTIYQPSLGVGGDFYDFIELPDGRMGIAIADVVGKGIPAALMMASVRSVLRATALSGRRIAGVIDIVNRHLSRDTLVSEFATLFYCVIRKDGRRLTYCNAGHNPPLLLRDGQITELAEGGLVLGIHREEQYNQNSVTLRPGDVVLLYTDGITEAASFEGQRFGTERLKESLRKYAQMGAQQIVKNILWDVRRFVGLAEQSDDQTMVAVKVGEGFGGKRDKKSDNMTR
jgi:phosphoserine phosphatase RsbU/P